MSALSPPRHVKPAAKAAISVVENLVLAIFMAGIGVVGGSAIQGTAAVMGGLTAIGLLSIGIAYYHGEDVREEAIDVSRFLGVVVVLLIPAMLGAAVYQHLSGELAAAIPLFGMFVTAMALFAFVREDHDDPVDFLRWSA